MTDNQKYFKPGLIEMIRIMILSGRWTSVGLYFIKRFYSKGQFDILRCDLTLPPGHGSTNISLGFRPFVEEDIPVFFQIDPSQTRQVDPLERLRLANMFKMGFQNCFVTILEHNIPCHICWIIDHTENEKIFDGYKGGIPPLARDEVLIENSFTLEQYRKRGIQSWSIQKFVEKGIEMGARSAFAYVRTSNTYSLKSFKKNGFMPYKIREDKWFMFERKFSFRNAVISDAIKLPELQ